MGTILILVFNAPGAYPNTMQGWHLRDWKKLWHTMYEVEMSELLCRILRNKSSIY